MQHRLRRDAGVVEAASAGLVHLDDRGLLAELGGADGGVVAARTAADDDHVEGISHAFDSIRRALSCRASSRPGRCGIWIRAIALIMKKKSAPAPAISTVVPRPQSTRSPAISPSERGDQDDHQQRLEAEHRPVARPPHPPGHRRPSAPRRRGPRGAAPVLALLDPVAADPRHLDAGDQPTTPRSRSAPRSPRRS